MYGEFVDCLEEIRLLLNNENIIEQYSQLMDVEWLAKLFFFTDLCSHLNELNIKLQGVNKTIIVMFDFIKAFEVKLQVFNRDILSNSYKHFSNTKKNFSVIRFLGLEKLDSLRQIVNIQCKNSELFKALDLKNMINEQEFKYLEEHLACAQPVAEAIDLLQGEKNTYYGIVFPCFVALRRKLQRLQENDWIFCKPLSEAYLRALEKRFEEFFNLTTVNATNASIAASSYPRFKNRWLSCIDTHLQDKILNSFKQAVSNETVTENSPEKQNTASENDFFDFGVYCTSKHSNVVMSRAELQILHYFD